uniref:2-hydroxyacyl-CoA lyase 2 n=1 Tax=Hirondellea gigas TaxID=1518452 RepID=A0A6A7G7L4_9CRUS
MVSKIEILDVGGKGVIIGAEVVVKSLKSQGVDLMFGVVGIPITPIAIACRRNGVKYIGMRNEQAASYAAGAAGYMLGKPAACLVVSGPGLIHGLAGIGNAWVNNWPMILISGCEEFNQDQMGAFQAGPQEKTVNPFVKFSGRPASVERIPYFIEKACRVSVYGRPGPTFVSIAANLISGQIQESKLVYPPQYAPPPRSLADPVFVEKAVSAILSAKRPLIIVGKGAAYARAEHESLQIVEETQIPFLPTPMGKGVIPDDHPLSIAPARSLALKADVILLLGARLNWQMHYGSGVRFDPHVKFIQIDICPEELGNNVQPYVALFGDLSSVISQLLTSLRREKYRLNQPQWTDSLKARVQVNVIKQNAKLAVDKNPMSYERVFKDVRDVLPRDCILVSEGANTMDIGRTILPNFEARSRLDAGTWGTMGVGMGFAIAAAIVHPNKKIVAVEGDSAFGFSSAELEAACRHNLNICVIIINNNGVYRGETNVPPDIYDAPPTSLTANAHYELIADAFGGKGFFVNTYQELLPTLKEAMSLTVPTVVNVMILPNSEGREADHSKL